MRVQILKPDNTMYQMDIWETTPVYNFTLFFLVECREFPERIKFVFRGNILEDRKTSLFDYGVKSNDVLAVWDPEAPDADARLTWLLDQSTSLRSYIADRRHEIESLPTDALTETYTVEGESLGCWDRNQFEQITVEDAESICMFFYFNPDQGQGAQLLAQFPGVMSAIGNGNFAEFINSHPDELDRLRQFFLLNFPDMNDPTQKPVDFESSETGYNLADEEFILQLTIRDSWKTYQNTEKLMKIGWSDVKTKEEGGIEQVTEETVTATPGFPAVSGLAGLSIPPPGNASEQPEVVRPFGHGRGRGRGRGPGPCKPIVLPPATNPMVPPEILQDTGRLPEPSALPPSLSVEGQKKTEEDELTPEEKTPLDQLERMAQLKKWPNAEV